MRPTALRFSLITLVVLITVSCTSNEDLRKGRAERAERGKGDIPVALVWNEPLASTLFDEGVIMAMEEINSAGGISGRKIKLQMHADVPEAKEKKVARAIAADPDILAVIGHPTSGTAIPVSLTYEKAGLLFISAGATSPGLTGHGFQYVFRNIPSDIDTGNELARFAVRKGFTKLVVIDDETEYGRRLANIFFEKASKAGIELKRRRSYFPWQTDFSALIADIRDVECDAIFLGGSVPRAAEVIKKAREMGITVPFIGGDGLDTPDLMKIAGSAAEGTIVSTIFNPDAPEPETRRFRDRFRALHGVDPDTWAAIGYDVVSLLSDALNRAGSAVPVVVSSYLRFIEDRRGVTGRYSMTKSGDISGKTFFFKVVRNGRFEYEADFEGQE